MAQKIAALLNIPFITLDFEKEYKSLVIDPMFRDYKHGLTPNPDILCNTIIKFPLLWKAARKIKADYIATGHYARIRKTSRGLELLQGKDKTKDQSYFLAELSQHDLEHTLFPIGNYTKTQIREIAKKHKFPNYDKPSTSGICFVGEISFKTFIEQRLKPKQGNVLDEHDQIIGTHKGAYYYTIGERARENSGIKITKGTQSQSRFFIAKKDIKKNTITVVPQGHELLKIKSFKLKKIHWINPRDKIKTLKANVRVRHLGELIKATLKNNMVTLSKPLEGIAPGQSAVFYISSSILTCSGTISRC
jgi:tRNA-specific 2-thiouridylase